jgi:epoxyqueuosine reductase
MLDEIVHKIHERMKQSRYKVKTVSIIHLSEIQDSVGKPIRQGLINKQLHESWHFYLNTNRDLPEAKTIIIVAIPQPITRLRFEWQGIIYTAEIAPNYINNADESQAEEILNNILNPSGYRVVKAHLALKTLAVRSGLATYGRNNISYISGMGSFCRLVAFYTDCSCEEDNWHEPKMMKACDNCSLCRENCPTGSITVNRFLIYAEKCLGFLSEINPDYPYWVQLQPDWENGFIGCMRCQFVCPVNKPYLREIVGGAAFSEEETDLILNKTPWKELSPETRSKLGISEGVYPLLPRNLRALIKKQNVVSRKS